MLIYTHDKVFKGC